MEDHIFIDNMFGGLSRLEGICVSIFFPFPRFPQGTTEFIALFLSFSLIVHIYQAYGEGGVRTLPDKDGNFFVAGSLDPEARVKVS